MMTTVDSSRQLRSPAMPTCEVCQTRRAGVEVYRKLGYRIMQCPACGFVFTDSSQIQHPERLYDEAYFTGGHRDGYNDYQASSEVLRREFDEVVRILEQYVPAGATLLEVGCAYGYFLDQAQATFRCVGIEVAEAAAAACRRRGHDVRTGTVTRQSLQDIGPLDAVVMLDVIEHLDQPRSALMLLREVMKPGATVLISTGDVSSLMARLMRSRWRLMTPPQHLSYFSRDSITQLLESCGLQVREISYRSKRVPLGLILYQATRRLGLLVPIPALFHRIAVPLNLFDAMTVIAQLAPPRCRAAGRDDL